MYKHNAETLRISMQKENTNSNSLPLISLRTTHAGYRVKCNSVYLTPKIGSKSSEHVVKVLKCVVKVQNKKYLGKRLDKGKPIFASILRPYSLLVDGHKVIIIV